MPDLDDLTRAARRLRAHPQDHGAWLELAALLAALGSPDDAELAFGTLGELARRGGQVALAIACGRHLAELGSVRGPELVDQAADAYAAPATKPARGSRKRKVSTGASRPPPVPDDGPPPPVVVELSDPLEDARAVIRAFGAHYAARPAAPVASVPLLSTLAAASARALAHVMTARAYPAGATIIELGAPATALYWLAHGSVLVERTGTVLGELHSGALFGEIALVGGTRRTASVIARDDVWLLEIPALAVEGAAERHPALADVLARHARQRLFSNLVRTSELFRALDDDDRDELLAQLTTELVPAGTAIIREGANNEYLWVVVAGRCEVRSGGAAIAELGAGAAVGEISLVNGGPAVAEVIAVEPAVLLRLAKRDFDVVAARHPALLDEVKKLVVERETLNRALFPDATDLIV